MRKLWNLQNCAEVGSCITIQLMRAPGTRRPRHQLVNLSSNQGYRITKITCYSAVLCWGMKFRCVVLWISRTKHWLCKLLPATLESSYICSSEGMAMMMGGFSLEWHNIRVEASCNISWLVIHTIVFKKGNDFNKKKSCGKEFHGICLWGDRG